MSVSKRDWNPRLKVEEAAQVGQAWLRRAVEMNVVTRDAPTLYQAYVLDEAPALALFKDLGSLFRYSTKDDPELHRARDKALRLLSVVLKAHYFLGNGMEARHEPYFFSFPDLSNASRPHYGLIHRLDATEPGAARKGKTIVVSTADLSAVSSDLARATRFPVVLPADSNQWIDLPRWAALAKQGDALESAMKPFRAKKEEEAVIAEIKDPTKFTYGALLDVPFEMKDVMKGAGLRWAKGLQKWYLPLGHDVQAVQDYLNWARELRERSPEAYEARFWRELPAKAPVRPAAAEKSEKAETAVAAPARPTGSPSRSWGNRRSGSAIAQTDAAKKT